MRNLNKTFSLSAPYKQIGKLTILLFILHIICLFGRVAEAKYGGGSGTAENPYLIYTAEQMNAIGLHKEDWDKNFKLMADIDLSAYTGTSFNIIGTQYLDAFTGVFDGNGKKVSNFTYTSPGCLKKICENGHCIGLFGIVDDSNAEIKDLGLIDPNVNTTLECCDFAIGSLVGYLRDGTITGCYTDGGSVLGFESVGGLIGGNSHGTITNCCATGSFFGKNRVGGLIGGNNYSGKITECYSLGSVMGVRTDAGGLVGHNRGSINNCYSTGSVSAGGSVSGRDDLGGLVGANWGAITNCYSVGNITERATDKTNVGGLVGRKSEYDKPSVMYCFWDTQTSGQSTSAGGTGKTTAEMQMASTFIRWGCDPAWTINRSDYPRLWWENKPGRTISARLSDFITGSGEPDDPYLIYTPEQLNKIGLFCCEWDKHFNLMEDIDLAGYTGTAFNIIGIDWDNPFTGIFDGNGHIISNFSYTSIDTDYIGLFGNVSGLIKDLGLIAPNIDAGTGDKVGSLVGHLNGDATLGENTIYTYTIEDNDRDPPVPPSPVPPVPPPPVPPVPPSSEGFETGDFSIFDWTFSGYASWAVTSEEKNSGTYSAQAGSISDNKSSTLRVELDCISGDISFHCKVYSEPDFDYLKFYINGVKQDEWSGEQDWTKVSFPVTAGIRTFEWTYSKDSSTSIGSDTAWIDDIVFPIN